MLEPLCGGGSDILRSCSGRCSGGGLLHRNADVDWLFQGHTVVESDGVVPAGPGWTSGSGFWSVSHKGDCPDLNNVVGYELLGYKWFGNSEHIVFL